MLKGPSVFSISVCVFVCLSVCLSVCLYVSALQVTGFVVGIWFLAWGTLEWIPKNAFFFFFFFFWNFEIWSTYGYFKTFCEFFALNPLSILKESVDRTKWHRDFKFGIRDLYMIINWCLRIFFQYSKNNFRFCGRNLNCYKDRHAEKSYFPLKSIFTTRDSLNIYQCYYL